MSWEYPQLITLVRYQLRLSAKQGDVKKSIMKEEEKTRKPAERKRQRNTLKMWSRLQMRMTISYVGLTVVIALLLELLLIVIFFVVLSPFIDQYFQGIV